MKEDIEHVAIYARVSTDKQKAKQTIDSQLSTLPEYAQQNGYKVVETYVDDGISPIVQMGNRIIYVSVGVPIDLDKILNMFSCICVSEIIDGPEFSVSHFAHQPLTEQVLPFPLFLCFLPKAKILSHCHFE